MGYVILDTLDGRKNKAKTNPIQSQFKPKQSQFKPNNQLSAVSKTTGPFGKRDSVLLLFFLLNSYIPGTIFTCVYCN